MSVQGTWNIGGYNLPDFGISERVGSLFGSQGSPQATTFYNPAAAQTGQMGPAVYAPTTPRSSNETGGSVLGSGTGSTQSTNLNNLIQGHPPASNLSPEEIARRKYEAQQSMAINKGWDDYTNQLNDLLNVGLPGQQAAQSGIAQTSYNQGINTLGSQKASSEQQVQTQQAANLKDLASNVKNLFQSGNIYLGSRGAGDSSAANQYSYAIGKLGSQARGDIQTQVSQRMQQIGDIYNQETGRLKSEYDTRISGIADWFNQAQNQIRSQIGQAGLGRSQDLQSLSQNVYNQALNAMQTLQAETSNRRQSLETWAMNNSKSVQELASNMQAAQQMPQFSGINAGMPSVDSGGNYTLPAAGYGSTSTKEKDLFGNIRG